MNGGKTLAGLLTALLLGGPGLAAAADVLVYKSPTCGCCGAWVEHMRANGFNVVTRNVEDLAPLKQRLGVSPQVASCHTAVVDGYVVEGHVPADVVEKLLGERPAVTGIAVPGMPVGSPGMEVPGRPAQPYTVVSFDDQGRVREYARR